MIGTSGTLDLQATQTFATLDLDGAISRSAGSSAVIISGASDIGGNITTTGTQTYTGAVTLSDDITLTTTNSNVTFSSTRKERFKSYQARPDINTWLRICDL